MERKELLRATPGRAYRRRRPRLPGPYTVLGIGRHCHTWQELVVCERVGAGPGETLELLTLQDFALQFEPAEPEAPPEKVATAGREGDEGRNA